MKTCLLAITGSVAAMKTPELVRALQAQEFDVHCVLTDSGAHFVAPDALAAVTGNAVLSNQFFQNIPPGGILAEADYSHLEWAKKADVIVLAPTSADAIARIASGRADGVFEAAILAAKCPVLVAPAMNTAMLEAAATQENIQTLNKRSIEVLPTESGDLACGDVGAGRLLPANEIALFAKRAVTEQTLRGKKVLITLGGTREYLDPVRYISNASSGKMGLALAIEAFLRGAGVSLLVGAVDIVLPNIFTNIVHVASAKAMLGASKKYFVKSDIAIFTAAVADFTPHSSASEKLKSDKAMNLKLVKVPDIAAELGKLKKKRQFTLGFALETTNNKTAKKSAQEKLRKKNLNAVFLNSAATLGSDTNDGILISKTATTKISGSKAEVARQILSLPIPVKPE